MGVIAAPASARTKVAVFNFQMQSETPEWVWLEKGLADRITTDFARSKRLTVIARDAMQRVAEQMDWVPEMAVSDPDRMGYIRKQLKIEYLISGVYRVTGDDVAITAQIVEVAAHRRVGRKIVEVATQREVARKEVSGKLDDVLVLQQRVSAELLSWFSGTPAARILPQLPVWTRSIPAVKALYEGMHLYDQGRYGEAWYRFRRAAREDPVYVEAQYWVGKMYYFMDRYLHARRAMERFVYMDAQHPRTPDAVVEYLHTYENLGAPLETILLLSDYFREKYAETMFPGAYYPLKGEIWFGLKAGERCFRQGRYKLAYEYLCSLSSSSLVRQLERRVDSCIMNQNLRTGEVLNPAYFDSILHEGYGKWDWDVIRFDEGVNEIDVPKPERLDADDRWSSSHTAVIAPLGHVFRSLSFRPVFKSPSRPIPTRVPDSFRAEVGLDRNCDLGVQNIYAQDSDLWENGVKFENLPRTRILFTHYSFGGPKPRKLFVAAEFEKVGQFGAIQVDCLNSGRIVVELNGHIRKRGSFVGLLAPDKYRMRVYCPDDVDTGKDPKTRITPFGEWTGEVVVRPGETTTVPLALPWKKDIPFKSWTWGKWVEGSPSVSGKPNVLLDDKEIRLIWGNGDLWSSRSTDGETFSPPVKIPLPLSSAWREWRPRSFRDESGRFLLLFLSDRDGQHRTLPYVSWSRDFVHWSAPAMVLDRAVSDFDIIQDRRGRFIFAGGIRRPRHEHEPDSILVRSSRDAYRWTDLAEIRHLDPTAKDPNKYASPTSISLVERQDGTLDLFVQFNETDKKRGRGFIAPTFRRSQSKDGRSWTSFEKVPRNMGWGYRFLHDRGRTVFWSTMNTRHSGARMPYTGLSMQREKPDGKWEFTAKIIGLVTDTPGAAYHPRWGYVFAWAGPHLMRGPSLDAFFDYPKKIVREPASRPADKSAPKVTPAKKPR